jgi:hypothetical protein
MTFPYFSTRQLLTVPYLCDLCKEVSSCKEISSSKVLGQNKLRFYVSDDRPRLAPSYACEPIAGLELPKCVDILAGPFSALLQSL